MIDTYFWTLRASLVAQTVKNPPAMQETQVPSTGQEDPLDKGMATYSNILAWRIPRTEEYRGQKAQATNSLTFILNFNDITSYCKVLKWQLAAYHMLPKDSLIN